MRGGVREFRKVSRFLSPRPAAPCVAPMVAPGGSVLAVILGSTTGATAASSVSVTSPQQSHCAVALPRGV